MMKESTLIVAIALALFIPIKSYSQTSNNSDIITTGGETTCIPSIINGTIATSTNGIQVWQFTVRDGGSSAPDADALPTIIKQIIITQGVSNTIADWTNIQSIGLFDGSTLIATGVIASTNITFSSLSINVPDNSAKTLSVRLTLKISLSIPTTIDGKAFRFSITPANVITGVGSSGYNSLAAVATTATGTNTVCVVATKLAFATQPVTTGQNNNMFPYIKVGAYDANNNLDVGFTQPISITSSGTMVDSIAAESAIGGIATFTTIKHSAIGNGFILTASSNNVSNAISSAFNIVVSTKFDPGDLAIIGINTTWTNAPALPLSNNSKADEISFVVFKDIQIGTTFYMTDNGYGRNTATSFGVTEGLVSFTRTGTILPAGSIVTIRGNGGTDVDGGIGSNYDNRTFEMRECGMVDTNWNVAVNLLGNNIAGFDLNPTDQVWIMQGGSWTKSGTGASDSSIYSNGTVLYGWSGINWKTATGVSSSPAWTTSGSMLYPKTGCFLNTLGGTTGVSKVKYTGGGMAANFTPTTKLGWIVRINNPANWSSYVSTGGINASYDNSNSNALYQASSTPNTDYAGYTNSPVCSFSLTPATEVDGNWNGNTSNDWFDCNNWDTKTVPDASISVNIKNSATNNCVVSNTSPFAYLYNNTANCLDLTINNKTLSTSNTNDSINVNGNFTLQNGSVLDMSNGGKFNLLSGNWADSASTFVSGIGTVIYSSQGIQTIAPENYNNLVSLSTGSRILPSGRIVGIKSLFSPDYPAQQYTITGSTVDFKGANTNQTIPAFTFYNAGFKNGGIKTLSGDDTILNALTVGNNPSTGDGTKLELNNNNITLHSDNNSTAFISSIATINGLPCSISYSGIGRFVIERYLPMLSSYTSRRWRLLTAPISNINAPTINAAWQEGAINIDKASPIDPNPRHGTEITYTTTSVNGYDQGSTNNPSIYYLMPNLGTWLAPVATNSGKITDNQGYMLFVRGDRSIVISNQYINTTAGTTLRVKGQINTGDITVPIITGKQIIANPYPSAINFSNVNYNGIKPGSTIGSTYYLWDPKLLGSNGVGAWVTFSSNGDNTYAIAPNPSDSIYMSQYNNKGTIESGSAFMLNAASNGILTIHESDKINTSSTIGLASRPAGDTSLQGILCTNLAYINSSGNVVLSDGVVTICSNDYNNEVDLQDAVKLKSFTSKETISILRNSNLLSIERRKPITSFDTIYFATTVASNSQYQLQFNSKNFNPLFQAILEDKFTNTSANININGAAVYNFTTTNDTLSTALNRFYLVFKPAITVPVTFTDIKAVQQNNDIAIQWNVENGIDIKEYEVEKSTDGKYFIQIASNTAVNDNLKTIQYNAKDTSVAAGYNYYRIKSVGLNGSSTYSDIVKVKVGGSDQSISIYPNPVINKAIALQLTNMPKGIYDIRLLNAAGAIILKKELFHPGGNATEIIPFEKNIAKGLYQLEITEPGGKAVFKLIN